MKRHLSQYVFSVVILVILVIPITTTVHQGSNNIITQTDPAKNLQDTSVVSADWLTGWGYRKSHQIIGTPGAGVNYQVELIVNFGAGTDSGNTVYCDSNCQSDFDDIRFTDDDGITLLDYWRETYYSSDNATFWVEVQDNLDTNVSIYIYMSNSTCSTTSNGTATFLFFDDFDDDSIDGSKWETYGPWTESGGVTAFSVTGTGGTSILPDLMTDDAWDMRNKSIVSRWRVNTLTTNREWGVSCANTVGDDHTRLAYFLATGGLVRSYYDASAVSGYDYYDLDIGIHTPSVFMKTEFVSTPSDATKNTWIQNGVVLDTYSGNSFDSTPQRIFIGFYVHGYTNTLNPGTVDMEFDYVFLRNQVGVEVTHDSWSDTESLLEGWDYRISHVINGAAGAGTNYQIQIIVHYGNGTNSGKDVYCEEKSQTDFDDIRFTDDDGVTLLDFWMEDMVVSDNASFWVEVRDDLSVDTNIYMYYGNSTVSSLSNGTATFIFFDDFENGNLDVWDDDIGWTISSSYFTDGAYGAFSSGGVTEKQLRHNMSQTESFLISLDARTFDNFNTFPYLVSTDVGSSYPCTFGWTNVLYHTGSYSNWPQNSTLSYNTWYNMQIGFDMNRGKVRGWKNDAFMGEVDFATTTSDTPSEVLAFRPGGGTQTGRDLALDNVYIRKWVPLEPTHGAWGEYTTISWHHDCSDTTGFVYNDTWNMNWGGMDWTITTGTLSSDGSALSVTYVPTGSNYHGPVYEYELAQSLRVRDINTFSALMDVVNSPSSYLGYEIVMLGDADRKPVLFFSFGDGWADYSQGAYGVSYVFEDGSREGYGSGYPITWTSFNGEMNVSYTDSGLMAYVEGFGQSLIPGLSEADFDREIKYVAIASARFGSDPLFPVLVDDLRLNYVSTSEPVQPSINDVEDFWYEASESDNVIEWTVANFNPTSYEIWRDGGLLTSAAWPGGSTIEIDIDNLSPGEYIYTIFVYGDYSTVVSDTVNVTVMDLTFPSLGQPADGVYEYGTTGNTIVWSVADLYPGEYVVTRDATLVDMDNWTSGTITIDTDGLAIGVYLYMIMITDSSANLAFDMVTITVVDTTAPILNHPSDIIGDIALASIQVSWQPTDLLPFNYEIYENDTLVGSGTWTSGENLTYTIDDLTTSSYNITIVVWDTSGNYARDTVLVNIAQESIQPLGDILIVTISIGSIGVIVVIVGLICKSKGPGGESAPPDAGYSW